MEPGVVADYVDVTIVTQSPPVVIQMARCSSYNENTGIAHDQRLRKKPKLRGVLASTQRTTAATHRASSNRGRPRDEPHTASMPSRSNRSFRRPIVRGLVNSWAAIWLRE
jgi:hypothetical protein